MRISKEQLNNAKKYLEYKKNPIKFMEECCYLPESGGDKLVKLYDPQKKIIKDFYGGTRHMILLKSRQLGFSTLYQLISVHLCLFYSNVIIGVTSKSQSEASDFCRKTYDIIDKLPKWLQPGYKWKSVQQFCTLRGSQLISSAISLSNPGALFRGKSISLLIMDEIAHAQKSDEAWTGVAAALSIAQKRAVQNNIPCGTILLSTPNRTTGIGKFFFDMWTGANEGRNSFKPYRIHWKEIDELRNDPNWYKNQCLLYNNDPRKIAQELELKFIGSGDTLFPEETQSRLQSVAARPKRTMRVAQGGELRIFEEPSQNRFYIIGVDTASSYGKDKSAIEVVDYKTMNQVIEYQGKLEPKAFSDVVRLVCKMVKNNIIVVENTGGYGLTVLNELQYDEETSYNLFEEYKDNNYERERKVGLSTSIKTRPLIIQAMYELVVENPGIVKSESLINELLSLVEKNGKVQADEGTRDDLTMAFAFCCYIRKFYHESIVLEEEMDDESKISETLQQIQELNGFSLFDRSDMSTNPKKFKRDIQKYIEDQIKMNRDVDPIELIWGENSCLFG